MDKDKKIAERLCEVELKIKKAIASGKQPSKGLLAEKDYYEKGGCKPECINPGCTKDVAWREKKYWSMKSECSRCMSARKKNKLIEGVTIWKKKYCENIDGRHGFKCPVDGNEWAHYSESLDLNHKDGNHDNNIPENVETLCKLCHGRHSREDGEWNSNKGSRRNIE